MYYVHIDMYCMHFSGVKTPKYDKKTPLEYLKNS